MYSNDSAFAEPHRWVEVGPRDVMWLTPLAVVSNGCHIEVQAESLRDG